MPKNTDWQNERIEKIWLPNQIFVERLCMAKLSDYPQEVSEVLADTCLSLCIAVNQNTDFRDERAWLFKTANNILKTKLKEIAIKKKKEVSLYSRENELVYDIPYTIDFIESLVKEESVCKKVGEIFASLSEIERQVFILYHIEHVSYKEIGDRYGMTADAAKQFNYRTKRKIAKLVGPKANELYKEI